MGKNNAGSPRQRKLTRAGGIGSATKESPKYARSGTKCSFPKKKGDAASPTADAAQLLHLQQQLNLLNAFEAQSMSFHDELINTLHAKKAAIKENMGKKLQAGRGRTTRAHQNKGSVLALALDSSS